MFHAVRSVTRPGTSRTWVRSLDSANARRWPCEGKRPATRSRSALPATKSEPVSSRVETISWYAPVGRVSSLSTKVRYSVPGARCRQPVLRAAPRPLFSCWTRRNRVSLAAYASAIAALPSVEPSSTSTHSKSSKVWAAIESRHSWR
ncbi:hypothetical protein ASE03_24005 [Kitasatospora sp. Root187]|nr:hypothetical protein ASE03_24005 [Kitasatospora sp. Root187]